MKMILFQVLECQCVTKLIFYLFKYVTICEHTVISIVKSLFRGVLEMGPTY